ncbi:MAG: dienelactone hydrolase family protein [Polyangiaceae bacterium]
MSLETTTVRCGSEHETGYFAYPKRAKTPLPAVLILQEAWGVDEHIEDVTRRFANAGYAALAPDLFARGGERLPDLTHARLAETQDFLNLSPAYFADAKARGAALAARPEAERARIEGTLAAIMTGVSNLGLFVPRLLAAVGWLRSECPVTRGGKVAAIGFCLGGGLAAQLACHDQDLAAAVIFYGSAPPPELVPKVACPILILSGSLDQRIAAQLPALEESLRSAGKPFESIVYEGAHHAFFNDIRPSYDVNASRDAFVRTLDLLRKVLVG